MHHQSSSPNHSRSLRKTNVNGLAWSFGDRVSEEEESGGFSYSNIGRVINILLRQSEKYSSKAE